MERRHAGLEAIARSASVIRRSHPAQPTYHPAFIGWQCDGQAACHVSHGARSAEYSDLSLAVHRRHRAMLHAIWCGGDRLCCESGQSDGGWRLRGCQSASDSAKIWVGVSVGMFLLIFVGYIILVAIIAAGTP